MVSGGLRPTVNSPSQKIRAKNEKKMKAEKIDDKFF